jgi:hypothetical protein
MCPCGVRLRQWHGTQPSESHVHLVNIVGLQVPSGDGSPMRTLEMAVPCSLQVGDSALRLGAYCELVSYTDIGMLSPRSNLQFAVCNAKRASMAYLRARQLHCPVQPPSDIFSKPPLGRLMQLLRLATGTLGSGREELVSWYIAHALFTVHNVRCPAAEIVVKTHIKVVHHLRCLAGFLCRHWVCWNKSTRQ